LVGGDVGANVVFDGHGENWQLLLGSRSTNEPSGHSFTSAVQNIVSVGELVGAVTFVGHGKNSHGLFGSGPTDEPSGHVHVGSSNSKQNFNVHIEKPLPPHEQALHPSK